MSNLKKFAIATAVILGLGMTGCAAEVQGSADHTQQKTTDNAQKAFDKGLEDGPTNSDEGADEETPKAVPSDLKWGESYVYEDGVEITLSAPEVMANPGDGQSWKEYAEYDDEVKELLTSHTPVKFTLQIRNKGDKVIDPSMASIQALAGEDTLDSSCIDSDCSFTISKLLPGRNVKATWAYFIPNNKADDLTVEVQPDWDHDSAIYLGGLSKQS